MKTKSRNCDVHPIQYQIESVLNSILAMRTEESFSEILEETKELLTACHLEFSFEAPRKRQRTQAYGNRVITEAVGERGGNMITLESFYFNVIDVFETEIRNRS